MKFGIDKESAVIQKPYTKLAFSIFPFYLKSREGPTGLLEWEGIGLAIKFNTTSHEVTKASRQIFWGHSMPELNLVGKWQSSCFP